MVCVLLTKLSQLFLKTLSENPFCPFLFSSYVFSCITSETLYVWQRGPQSTVGWNQSAASVLLHKRETFYFFVYLLSCLGSSFLGLYGILWGLSYSCVWTLTFQNRSRNKRQNYPFRPIIIRHNHHGPSLHIMLPTACCTETS